jgi:hypothetical protein
MAYTLGMKRGGFYHNYGLTIVLLIMFLLSWLAQGIFEWFVVADEAKQHGDSVEVADYLASFGQSTFENWQSEFLQLLTMVTLSSVLLHKGSPQSRDDSDATSESLHRIEKRLDKLEGALSALDDDDKKERKDMIEEIMYARKLRQGSG